MKRLNILLMIVLHQNTWYFETYEVKNNFRFKCWIYRYTNLKFFKIWIIFKDHIINFFQRQIVIIIIIDDLIKYIQ